MLDKAAERAPTAPPAERPEEGLPGLRDARSRTRMLPGQENRGLSNEEFDQIFSTHNLTRPSSILS